MSRRLFSVTPLSPLRSLFEQSLQSEIPIFQGKHSNQPIFVTSLHSPVRGWAFGETFYACKKSAAPGDVEH